MHVATRIPLDLMRTVASWLEISDLLAMLMTSTLMNKALTPILYSTMDLRSWDGLLRCLATLVLLPEERAFHRDLAILVRTLVIQRPPSRRPFYATDYALSLSTAVARMTNLRYFSSKIGLTPCSLDILFKLVSGTCPRIQTIDIIVSDELAMKFDIRTLRVPSTLRELRLVLSDEPGPVQNPFVRKLLAASGPFLRSLALRMDGHYNAPFWQEILPQDVKFANLDNLVIGGSALFQPCFQSATQVRTLEVTNSWNVPSDVHLAAFPELEDLSCPWETIPHFLVDDPEYRRPIKTIHIDDVSCERRGASPRDPREWTDILALLLRLQYTSVPVKTLSFEVKDIPLTGFAAIRVVFVSLEYLAIVVHERCSVNWLHHLATDLIAHMPRLHTLLVTSCPEGKYGKRVQSPFVEWTLARTRVERALKLSRKMLPLFEMHCPTLNRIAFSTVVEIRKRERGWYWIGADPCNGEGYMYPQVGGEDKHCAVEATQEDQDEGSRDDRERSLNSNARLDAEPSRRRSRSGGGRVI